jgi:hypothetical protein
MSTKRKIVTFSSILKSKAQLLPIRRFFMCGCMLAVLALGDVAHSQQCVTPPSGIIAWWAADGDASDIEGNHNGTLNNGTSFAAGEVGQAFSFDSTQHQYVDVGFLDLPVTYTIVAWIYPTDIQNGSGPIINSNDNFNGYFFDFVNSGNLRAKSIHQTGFGGSETFYTTVPIITANNWQHIAVTYDGNAGAAQKFKFYVNGAAVALAGTPSHDEGGAPGISSVTTKIAANAPFPMFDNFAGLIDKVELFNRALDANEIAAIYNAGSAGQCKPQLAVSTSTAIPNGVGNFTALFRPSFNGGALGFFGTGSGGQQGIYFKVLPTDPCRLIADLNTPIPDGTGNFLSFTNDSSTPIDPCIGGDNVVFYGTGSEGQRGIYFADITVPPTPIKIADLNTAIPGGTGNFTDFVPPTPILPLNPIVSGNTAAFFGAGSGGQQGIYAVLDITVPPTPIKIADLNTAIPGGTGNFTGFPGGPALSGYRLAFIGNGASSQQGVYLVDDISGPEPPPIKIADLFTAIPDGSGNFTGFGAVSVSATDVAFIGNGSGGQTGIYDQTGGQLLKVVTVGQNLAGKTVTDLSLNTTGLVGDPIAYQATFDDGSQALYVIDVFPIGAPMAQSAFSRKAHGGAGTFDVPLPLTGNVGIECRSGGATNDYQMIINFDNPVTVDSASVTSGTGSVSDFSVSGSQVTVNLTGVTNAQRITVTLFNVNDGTHMGNVPVSMGVLVGDVNGNAAVNASDVSLTKSQVGQAVSGSNFREDVNANGLINSVDVALVKSKVGTALPP